MHWETLLSTPANLLRPLQNCRKAAQMLRAATTIRKNAVLEHVVKNLLEQQARILKANAQDLKSLDKKITPAFRDRLLVNETKIRQMAESLRQVAALSDPVGEVVETKTLTNGLRFKRVRSPLGVIYMIFESRPNVAIEAFSLAFKSGNVIILRGGKESMRTVSAFYQIISDSLKQNGFPASCLWGITNPDRKLTSALLKQRAHIDVVVPRGGDGLIKFVVENSEIPIIKNDRGLCHVYAHEDADIEMAIQIVENAKVQRPGVCNSMETLLVHESVAPALIPALYKKISVEWYGCPVTRKLLKGCKNVRPANSKNWDTEYLDLKMNCRVVKSLQQAIEHIELHGSRHSEAIVTRSTAAAKLFQSEIDAAAVYWNASTRFTDGFEMGLGGELGISTQKLHVRGPVGLRELTSIRWLGDGQGQIRRS